MGEFVSLPSVELMYLSGIR